MRVNNNMVVFNYLYSMFYCLAIGCHKIHSLFKLSQLKKFAICTVYYLLYSCCDITINDEISSFSCHFNFERQNL